MKTVKWLVLLTMVGSISWVAFKWYSSQNSVSADALSLIPPDAVYCITLKDPLDTWKQIAGSATWSHLQKNSYFASLTSSANSLDSIIRDNELLSGLVGSRALIVSAHVTGPKQYDFLFLADLETASGIKFVNEYFSGFATKGVSVQKEKYHQEDLLTIHNTSGKSDLYVSFPGHYLVASYSKKILTASLDANDPSGAAVNETFIKTKGTLSDDGLMTLYVNYAMLPAFVNCYSSGTNEYVNRLANTLKITALCVTLEEEIIKATGYTSINDSVESYIKTLAVSGQGPSEFFGIAPQRTAFALSLGFRSFGEFFANFEKNIQQDVTEYNAYRENLKQAESYLNIDLQEHFISWIGDEVALLELQSSGEGLDNETALIFKADNIEKARKDLAHIEKMVRRKTPVNFKAVDHRGYSISYLSMKGLFRVLLGKFFARYDKPYYTVVNNFVIFSGHPQTLKSIIDDYLSKATLARSEEFRSFRKQFDDESAAFVYLNTPVLFNAMKKMVDTPTRSSMEKNKGYIVCFRQAGFQLVPGKNGFKTTMAENFVAPEPEEAIAAVKQEQRDLPETGEEGTVEVVIASAGREADPMSLPYIYAQNLNGSSYTSFFPDSTVHFEVGLKNGFKNGDFTEYYESGDVKMKGHFKDDKRDGLWRLFDENGTLILKRIYEDDEIKREKNKE